MELAIVFWLLCAIIGAMIGSQKGSGGSGFFLGLLLGPLGLIIIAVSSGDRSPCPFCREPMRRGALVCPHCQQEQAVVPQMPAPIRTIRTIEEVQGDRRRARVFYIIAMLLLGALFAAKMLKK